MASAPKAPERGRDGSRSAGMGKPWAIMGMSLLVLAGFAAFTGWAFFATQKMGHGWSDLAPIWPYVVGGVAVTAILAGFLMWLAFYSANHGYDDRIDNDDPP